MGVFYPKNHIVAVFPDPEIADRVVRRLWDFGFPHSDAIATDGRALIDLEKQDTGVASFVMQSLSRFLATEQLYTDHDLHHARHGAGFVAVRCDTDRLKDDAWTIIKAESPIDARYYATAGIEHLAGDPKTD